MSLLRGIVLVLLSLLDAGDDAASATFAEQCEALRWSSRDVSDSLPQVPATLSTHTANVCCLTLAEILIQAGDIDKSASLLEAIRDTESESVTDHVFLARLALARGIVAARLRQGDELRRAMELFDLAENTAPIPRRYRELAALLAANNFDENQSSPLDTLTSMLGRIVRDLSEGKTDAPIQGRQEQAMKSLDKMIEQLEQQLRGGEQQESSGGSKPASASRPFRLRAPGEVDDRDIGNESGWGSLPPKEREPALHRLERDFPTLYRELIEAYFREMAEDEGRR